MQEQESTKTKTVYKLVSRIAENWRHWARRRSIQRQKGEIIVDKIIGKELLSKIRDSDNIKESGNKIKLNSSEFPKRTEGNADSSSLKLFENWDALDDAKICQPKRPIFIPASELKADTIEIAKRAEPITVSGVDKTILNSVELLEKKLLQLYSRRDEYLYLTQKCLEVKDFKEYESILCSLQVLNYSRIEEDAEISSIKVDILKLAESLPHFAPLIH